MFQESLWLVQCACILGKLVSDRMVSRDTLQSALMSLWKIEGNLSFKVLGDNLFLVDFSDPKDKERVLKGRPWVYEGHLFLVEDFDGITPPSQFSFDKAAFWVRMIDLPLACMCLEIGQKIGASVGEVEAVDTDAEGIGWGKYLRVKIRLDLEKPLPRGRKINIEGTATWITFQYERLPKFCFQCGAIRHGKTGCSKRTGLHQQDTNQYGSWLRAASPTRKSEKFFTRPQNHRAPNFHHHEEEFQHRWDRGQKNSDDRGKERDTSGDGGRDPGESPVAENLGAKNGKSGKYGWHGDSMRGVNAHGYRKKIKVTEVYSKKELGKSNTAAIVIEERDSRVRDFRDPTKMGPKNGTMKKPRPAGTMHGMEVEKSCPGVLINEPGMGHGKLHQTKEILGQGETSMSPGSYMGPSISDVEKSMQEKGYVSKSEKGPINISPGRGTGASKKRSRGEIEGRLETYTQAEGQRRMSGQKDGSPDKKGRKLSTETNKTIGSGMAEAVMQPRRPQ
jgi:hypothetical protein